MAATGPGEGKKAAGGSSLHSKTLLKSEQLYQYILESTVFPREPDCLRELRVATTAHPMSGMAASPDQVQLFGLLIEMLGARNAIEVGVFTGYSLLATALALPDDGKVVAIDVNRESYDRIGSRVVEKAGMAHKIDFRVGLALPVLDQLVAEDGSSGKFDFAFVDADKANFHHYHERLLRLVRVGGLIAYDNTLWGGSVAAPDDETLSERDRELARIAREFNAALTDDRRVQVEDVGTVRLFVGLPINSVTDGAAVNSARGIEAGIRAVKLLGVDGVELQVFWSVVQPESPDRFSWAGYRAVADMARAEGLSLRVSLRIHGSPGGNVPKLPAWVGAAAASDPDILFTDSSGARHEDCLSFAVDELPVLAGLSPLQRYEAFFRSFANAFEDLFDSTITDVTVGLGPNGELRYPSYPPGSDAAKFIGVGEFQCYDKYMLAQLKQHAEAFGQPLWGLSGPHDTPRYHESPDARDFFRDQGGSWESPYGDFFLSWYAGKLLSHGDRVLGIASRVFGSKPVELSAKVPFMHWFHGAKSRPAEAVAGFYKSNKKNGYSPVAKVFASHGCTMVVPGMDVCMNKQHRSTGSSPDQLMVQIKNACRRHGARIAGENASLVMTHTSSFSRIRSNILTTERMRPSHFTYQRMGAQFFSPEHWPQFTEFVRSVVCGEWDDDDEERQMAAEGSEHAKAWEAQAV